MTKHIPWILPSLLGDVCSQHSIPPFVAAIPIPSQPNLIRTLPHHTPSTLASPYDSGSTGHAATAPTTHHHNTEVTLTPSQHHRQVATTPLSRRDNNLVNRHPRPPRDSNLPTGTILTSIVEEIGVLNVCSKMRLKKLGF
ncbi:hypothetical protein V8G54_001795 [Vigna mungo]|uniref:Uncharacterized protein n=1 Tax=Vigna mungo TaxID=3915 RepID=A0AAQ3SBU7_VIGMU